VTQPTPAAAERRHDLDALRTLALLALLLYHSSRPFDLEPWHVMDDERSLALQVCGMLLTPWRLPLLFMISGLGTSFALGVRAPRRYVRDRLRRLLIPLAAGMVLVVPPQVYVERVSAGMPGRLSPIDFHGSFLAFVPHAFSGVYPRGNLSWHHLWFLAYLLVFSLVALPLFLRLRSPGGRRALAALAAALVPGARVFLLLLPLAVIHVALRGRFPATHALVGDWWNLAHYFVLFLLGFALLARAHFCEACARNRHLALALYALSAALRAWLVLAGGAVAPYSTSYALLMTLRAVTEWTALVAVIGYAYRHLRRSGTVLRWAGERVYPFYVWHHTVIVVLAWWMVQGTWPALATFALLGASALGITRLLGELARLTAPTRLLFGIRAR
jgi:peptidoglycan/LPS O-acetylase OafA/YrhL